MNSDDFKKLLDFSSVSNKHGIFEHANTIAKELLLNWQIRSECGSQHSMEAVEFYLIIPKIFEDDSENQDNGKRGASHKRIEQLASGTFYVHTKSKSIWTTPIFNRHGFDITCGNTTAKIYGSILIRHIGGINHKDGSGRALRVVMRGNSGHATIPQGSKSFGWSDSEKQVLKELNGADICSNKTGIRLMPAPSKNNNIHILSGKRIGVEKTRYADEHLRFFVFDPAKRKV